MHHASIPLPFWDEIFASIVYLINRLPNSSQHLIPSQTLFHKQPDYSSLRVLGCLCFPYTRPYNTHKLETRSLPCVFIGYAHPSKGYKCLHIPTNKIFVSRHVVFNEARFPFQEKGPSLPQSTEQPASVPLWLAISSTDRSASGVPSSPDHCAQQLQTNADRSFSVAAQISSEPAARASSSSPAREPTVTPTHPARISKSSDRLNRSVSARTSSSASARASPSTSPSLYSSAQSAPSNTSPSSLPIDGSLPLVPSSSQHHMITRSKANIHVPKQFPDYVTYTAVVQSETEPLTFHQAVSLPQ